MSCGFTGCGASLTLDPHKRVHYSHGLVLGVDEFVQAELYFLAAGRRRTRGLHGYGTVCGLGVSVQDEGGGPEVRVAPGYAIDAMGREIRVGSAQCARLDTWLARQAETGSPPLSASPGEVEVWVTLCYRECKTDLEPIPGEPCRTPEESMTPTRIAESFDLRLDRARPDQTELETVRAFARLLGRIAVIPAGTADLTVEELEAEVAALAPGSPAGPLPSPAGSPPGSPAAPWRVPEAEIEAYLAAAFRVWVTVVRPALLPAGRHCADGPGGAACIELARLVFPVTDAGGGPAVDGGAAAVSVDESARPYLLHTQLIQELLRNGGATGAGGATAHGDLTGLEADDHEQYLLVDRAEADSKDVLRRPLSGGDTHSVIDLPQATAAGQAMPHGQAVSGDLAGHLPDPQVVGLWDLALPDPSAASVGSVLTVAGNGARSLAWTTPATGGGEAGEEELVRIFALSWVHNQPSGLQFTLIRDGREDEVQGVAVGFGRRELGDAEVQLGVDRENFEPRALDLGSLDKYSFRLFAEFREDIPGEPFPGGSFFRRVRIEPIDLIPIKPDAQPGARLFRRGEEIDGDVAPAALLRIDRQAWVQLIRNELLVIVEIDGDHVIEADGRGRAIDAEFLRSALPTGDRPEGVERGTQGGLFRSWINRAQEGAEPRERLDVNRASVEDLVAARIAPQPAAATRLARLIVEAREQRPDRRFDGPDDLRDIFGIGSGTIAALSDTSRFFFGRG